MASRTFMVYEIVPCPRCKGKRKVLETVVIDPDTGRSEEELIDCPKCDGIGNVYSPISLEEALKAFMVDVPNTGLYGIIVPKEPKEEQ